jgi:hypothetical protein
VRIGKFVVAVDKVCVQGDVYHFCVFPFFILCTYYTTAEPDCQ